MTAMTRAARVGMVFWFLAGTARLAMAAPIEVWLTDPGGEARFQRQAQKLHFAPAQAGDPHPVIRVEPAQKFQTMDGFGFTLTGGSAGHLMGMTATARAGLLRELFRFDATNIGISYLRVSVGASDLDERPFSYNDLAPGQTDPELKHFDLAPDRRALIPVLKEILQLYPDLKIMGSPWSPPAWMKTNQDTRGGSLKPEFYDAYARYFVKYLQAMAAEGIRIDAVTVQNEPLHPGNNPSLLMLAPEQALFVKRHLGPALRGAGLDTKIIIYDHNADRPDYPISILDDPEAKAFIDGSAFHLYAGNIAALSQVHAAHPDRHIYFTEQWIGAPGNLAGDLRWHVKNLVVGASRNWARTVLEWNLSSNPQLKPHTDRGGCDRCLGGVTIDGDRVTRNPAYYILAHAAKFVRPGSVRVASEGPASLPNVAFKTPANQVVVIVLNEGSEARTFSIRCEGQEAKTDLAPGAVATLVWK